MRGRDETTAIDGVLLSAAGRAGRAAGVDHRDGHGHHRPGREAPGHRRSRLRLRARPVPGRVGRPADHRATTRTHRRTSRRSGSAWSSGRRPSRRCSSTPTRRRRGARARASGPRRRRRLARAPRRRRPHGAPARQPGRPRRPRADDRARDPLAADQRPARRERAPDRAGRQQPHAREPRGPLDHRALRPSRSASRTSLAPAA